MKYYTDDEIVEWLRVLKTYDEWELEKKIDELIKKVRGDK